MRGIVDLRPARPGDGAGIARVHVETWRVAYAGIVPDDYLLGMTEMRQTRYWEGIIRRSEASEAVVVAEATRLIGRRVVGFANCGPAHKSPGRGEVFTLYVASDWQGRGIGHRLLYRMFATLHAAGRNEALIWVLSANPARFFYEAMEGRRVAERREPFADVVLDETAYLWPDLTAWLASRGGKG